MLKVLKAKITNLLKQGAADILIGNFTIKFVTLCGSMFIVRLLTKNEYGILGYVENLYNYIYIIVGLGLATSVLRYNILAETKEERKGILAYILKKQTLINVIILIGVAIFSIMYNHPAEYSNAVYLLPLMVLALPFQDVTQSCLNNERANFKNRRYVVFSVMIAVVSVVSRIIGSWAFGVTGTIVFKLIGESICTIILFYLCYRKYFSNIVSHAPTIELKGKISYYGLQNMISNGIWVMFMITDIFLIGKLCSDPSVLADYKVAYMFPSNMAILTSSVGVFITPYFIRHETDKNWVKTYFFKTFFANAGLICSLTLILFLLAKPVILIVFGSDYLNVVPLMRVLLIAHMINDCFKNHIGNLLAAMGHVKTNIIVSSIGFVTQVAMGLVVIPRYGTMGLAIGSIFVYAMMSVIMFITFAISFDFFRRHN